MAKIFISHSSVDSISAEKLAKDIKKFGYDVWLDKWNIQVGQSIPEEIGNAIEKADYIAVLLTKNSVKSKWLEREWQSQYCTEINKKEIKVLSLLFEDCTIPTLMRLKKHADFREHYIVGFSQLISSLSELEQAKENLHVDSYGDFIDIGRNWEKLFKHSSTMDLIIMYASSWRNTYLKYIREMVNDNGARVRIVLPDNKDEVLMQKYSERLNKSKDALIRRIDDAVDDFKEYLPKDQLEIYMTRLYLNHAIYLFDTACVIALYSYRISRNPTPAFKIETGKIYDFCKEDFEWLVKKTNTYCKRIF